VKNLFLFLFLLSLIICPLSAQAGRELSTGDPLQRIKVTLPPFRGLTPVPLLANDSEITESAYKHTAQNSSGITWQTVAENAKNQGYKIYGQAYRMTSSQNSGRAELQFSTLTYVLLFEKRTEFIAVILSFDENNRYLFSTVYQADRQQPEIVFNNSKTPDNIIKQFIR
jgi:cell division protein FtsW (lipid II flippase)